MKNIKFGDLVKIKKSNDKNFGIYSALEDNIGKIGIFLGKSKPNKVYSKVFIKKIYNWFVESELEKI